MDEQELLKKTVGAVCDIFGAEPLTKAGIISYILNESRGKTYEIQRCIVIIHDLIHEYENEHLYENRLD